MADSLREQEQGRLILAGPGPVLIVGDQALAIPGALASSDIRCLGLPARNRKVDLHLLLNTLAEMEINEIQVEAGARLCGALLNEQLVDEILIYQAPMLLGQGGPGPFALGPLESMAERTHLQVLETSHLGDDLRIRLQPEFRR